MYEILSQVTNWLKADRQNNEAYVRILILDEIDRCPEAPAGDLLPINCASIALGILPVRILIAFLFGARQARECLIP